MLYSRLKQWQLYLAPQNDTSAAASAAAEAAALALGPASQPGARPSLSEVLQQQSRHSPRHVICDGIVSALPCSAAAAGSPSGDAHEVREEDMRQQFDSLRGPPFHFGAWVCTTGDGGCRQDSRDPGVS